MPTGERKSFVPPPCRDRRDSGTTTSEAQHSDGSAMKGKRYWLGTLGLACALCVFIIEFPVSLVPFALFLYIALPGPSREKRLAERREAIRKSSAVRRKTRPRPERLQILDPVAAPSEQEPEAERVLEETTA